jgi:hypothetical protein
MSKYQETIELLKNLGACVVVGFLIGCGMVIGQHASAFVFGDPVKKLEITVTP